MWVKQTETGCEIVGKLSIVLNFLQIIVFNRTFYCLTVNIRNEYAVKDIQWSGVFLLFFTEVLQEDRGARKV